MTMDHRLMVTFGDRSDDGHGKTEVFRFLSNKDSDEFLGLTRRADAALSFSFSEICSDYEDCVVKDFEIDGIRKLGVDVELYVDGSRYVDVDGLFNMWMAVMTKVDPTFEWVLWEDDFKEVRIVDDIGYGLFF